MTRQYKGVFVKNIISLTLMTAAFVGYAGAQPIVSVGDFKIGMTEEEFLDVQEIKIKNVKDVSMKTSDDRYLEYLGRPSNIVWKMNNESKNESYSKIYSPEITDYEFSMLLGVQNYGKDSHKITARFYENKLISIRIPDAGSDFEELLESKYGKPLKKDNATTVICQNGYGARSEHFNGSMTSVWGEGKPIKARIKGLFFGCGKFKSEYYIEDIKKVSIVDAIEIKAQKEHVSAEKNNKASSSRL